MIETLISFHTPLLGLHFLVAIFLIITILLQSGKGGDVGGIFGSGSSSSLFGTRGAATLLSKMTTYAAIIFLVTSISLAMIAKYEAKGTGEVDKLLESTEPDSIEIIPKADDKPIEVNTELDKETSDKSDGSTDKDKEKSE